MKWHFWYSYKQKLEQDNCLETAKGVIRNTYAIVNGREVLYTEKTCKKEYTSTFEDVVYLGYGEFKRTEEDRIYNKLNRTKGVPSVETKKYPVTVKIEKTGTGYKTIFEIGDCKIVKYPQTQQRVVFEKSRIVRLQKLIEESPRIANQLIAEYKNN